MPKRPTTRDYRDNPTYWFATLDIARERGDYSRAADAQRELTRLGVSVRYRRRTVRRKGASVAPS